MTVGFQIDSAESMWIQTEQRNSTKHFQEFRKIATVVTAFTLKMK